MNENNDSTVKALFAIVEIQDIRKKQISELEKKKTTLRNKAIAFAGGQLSLLTIILIVDYFTANFPFLILSKIVLLPMLFIVGFMLGKTLSRISHTKENIQSFQQDYRKLFGALPQKTSDSLQMARELKALEKISENENID